jgi:large subunit ribosomal protein L24
MGMRLKVGDEVAVICGEDRGKKGKVLRVLEKGSRLVVSGVRLQKKCIKKSQQNQEGRIVEGEMPIHRSNVRKLAAE